MQGQVLDVSISPVGDELASDHPAGSTTLTLMDSLEFYSETGGFLQIEDEVYEYDTVDVDLATVHLLTGLLTDREEGERVLVLPLSEEKWAMVDTNDLGEPISARVAHGLKDKMVDGVRDEEEQETVVLEMQEGDWVVTDIVEEVPSLDGAYIRNGTLDVTQQQTSDGNAPASSPTPDVRGGIGAFYLRWTPPDNADPLRFEVHVSDTTGFVPDSTTLYTVTSSFSATVRHLVVVNPETEEPRKFSYDTPYYFRIVALDEDGAADPSVEASGMLYQITGPDIGANQVTAENIDVGTLTGDLFSGTIVLGSTITTGALDDDGNIIGARAEMGPEGISTVDSAGEPVFRVPLESTDDAYLKAHVDLLSADIRDNFTMHGTNNSIATEGELSLAAGVSPPTAPPVLQEVWDTIQLDKNTAKPPHVANKGYNLGTFSLNPSQITSITWDAEWNCWAVVQQKSAGFRIWRFKSTGEIMNNFGTGRAWIDDYNDRADATACFNETEGGTSHLSRSGTDWYVWGKTPGGADVINHIPDGWIIDTAARPPVLAYDGLAGQYMLVQNNGGGSGVIHIRRFTLNGGSGFPNATNQGATGMEAQSGLSRRINGCVYGKQITQSANRYVVTCDDYRTTYVFTAGGVLQNDNGSYECWLKPDSALGSCHNGTQFASVDATGKITLYEDWTWTEQPASTWIAASAFDSDTAGDPANPHTGQTAGQHETPVGTFAQINLSRRSKLRITVPETNDSGGADDPDKWKIYWYRGGTTPPTDKTLLKNVDTIGSPTSATSTTIASDPTGGAPPGGIRGQAGALNNFPGANPARIESAAEDTGGPLIQLIGNGSGRIGPWQWGSDGKTATDHGPERPGTIIFWPGPTIPSDCEPCDGQAVSRPIANGGTTDKYKRVWEALGTTWGAGNGSTTFNLPDLRRRFLWGATTSEWGSVQPGYTDGVSSPSSRNPSHSHSISGQSGSGFTEAASGGLNVVKYGDYNGHAHGGSTGSASTTGGSGANTFPNAAVWFIIKL